MRHYWVWHGSAEQGYEECAHCGMRRRQREAYFGHAVNRMRPRYRITEYAKRGGFWKWIKRRQGVPKCLS